MTEPLQSPPTADEQYVPVGRARKLALGAPLRWLRLGLADFRRAPLHGLAYGGLIVLGGYLLLALAWLGDHYVLLFSLVTGFLLVGPVLAFALYDISRQLESGQQPSFRHSVEAMRRNLTSELTYAAVLTVVVLLWARAAAMVHVFFPAVGAPTLRELGGFFAVGSAVGALFAGFVFAISVFSLPMMMDRRADVIVAAITSMRAVLDNRAVMLLWAALIVALIAIGFVTALLGLLVILPVLGHATWHGYRDTIER